MSNIDKATAGADVRNAGCALGEAGSSAKIGQKRQYENIRDAKVGTTTESTTSVAGATDANNHVAISVSPPTHTTPYEWSNSDYHARVLAVPNVTGSSDPQQSIPVSDICSQGWALVCTL
jgi:hypothetical protein